MKKLLSVLVLASLLTPAVAKAGQALPLTADHQTQNSIQLAQQPNNTNQVEGYCFSVENETLSSQARIYVETGNKVTGTVQATIHDEKQGYYSSYIQTLNGTKSGNQFNLNITTKIELDTQKTKETWTLNGNTLNTGRTIYERIPCAVSSIRFSPGTRSGSVENAVVRGSRNIHILKAKQGQVMNLKMTSVENNALFDVVAPNGQVLKSGATQTSLKLPSSGTYEIIIGGTRGNANYKLTVNIR